MTGYQGSSTPAPLSLESTSTPHTLSPKSQYMKSVTCEHLSTGLFALVKPECVDSLEDLQFAMRVLRTAAHGCAEWSWEREKVCGAMRYVRGQIEGYFRAEDRKDVD